MNLQCTTLNWITDSLLPTQFGNDDCYLSLTEILQIVSEGFGNEPLRASLARSLMRDSTNRSACVFLQLAHGRRVAGRRELKEYLWWSLRWAAEHGETNLMSSVHLCRRLCLLRRETLRNSSCMRYCEMARGPQNLPHSGEMKWRPTVWRTYWAFLKQRVVGEEKLGKLLFSSHRWRFAVGKLLLQPSPSGIDRRL